MNVLFEVGKIYFYEGIKTLYSQIEPSCKTDVRYRNFKFMFLSEFIDDSNFTFHKILILENTKIGWIYSPDMTRIKLCQ